MSTRKYRKFKNDVYRRNRSDPELEKKARYNECKIELSVFIVREWEILCRLVVQTKREFSGWHRAIFYFI